MSDNEEAGTLTAILQNFNDHNFKRLTDIRDSVNQGNLLTDSELEFLEGMYERAKRASSLVSRHDDYHELFGKVVSIYDEVSEKAMENEKKAP